VNVRREHRGFALWNFDLQSMNQPLYDRRPNSDNMWVERTESEVAEARQRQRRDKLRAASVFGGFTTVLVTFFYGWGDAWAEGRVTVPADQFLYRLQLAVVCGAICTLFYYKFERKRAMMICPKCEVTKYDDKLTECSCGGHFHKFEDMKYVA